MYILPIHPSFLINFVYLQAHFCSPISFPIASTLCEVLAKVHSVEIMKESCCMFVCLWSLNSLRYVLQNIYSMTELSILIIAVCLSGHLFFLPSPEIWQRSLFPLCSIRFAWSIQQVANEKCLINKTPPVPQDVESSIKTISHNLGCP